MLLVKVHSSGFLAGLGHLDKLSKHLLPDLIQISLFWDLGLDTLRGILRVYLQQELILIMAYSSIMAYGSMPYVGVTLKKIAVTLTNDILKMSALD